MLYVGEYLDLFSIALIREAWLEYGSYQKKNDWSMVMSGNWKQFWVLWQALFCEHK